MTARERIMVYVLGGLATFGVKYAAYTQFIKPIRAANARIEELDEQVADREAQLAADERNNKRLAALLPVTLPANRELAEAEYEALLVRLFRDSKINGKYLKQAGTTSVSDPEPELVPGVPGKPGRKAYTKVIYKIDFEKVTLAKLSAFVERYNKVPLMQQIVSCTVKHSAGTNPSAALKLKAEERTDLTVTLISEAVLMDGAPERKTLFDVPAPFGAALGGPALYGLRQDTEKARYLTPTPDPVYYALADIKREYELLAARDIFHGPLPVPKIPPKPPEPGEEPEPPLQPPPPDPSRFTILNSLVRTELGSTRTALADIRDQFYDQYYKIEFAQFGNLFEVKVRRFTKYTKTNEKTKEVTSTIDPDPDHPKFGQVMQLSDRASKEIRLFKVYGLYGNAILLGEKEKLPDAPKEAKAKGGRPPQKGAKAPPVVLPKPDPRMAAIGGMGGVAVAKEKYYLWEVGQSLLTMRQLSDKDAKSALAVAALGLKDPPPPALPLEPAPPPRPVQVLTRLDG